MSEEKKKDIIADVKLCTVLLIVFGLILLWNSGGSSTPQQQPQQHYTYQQPHFPMPPARPFDPNCSVQDFFQNPGNQNNPIRVESQRRADQINRNIENYRRNNPGGFLVD